ncbi:MAG TPA: carboxypeptidase-like regulatory domain-containing protein [Cyclobacteriaceae bacterium]|nr:carboxypeptidase-like regulatory domain-containing protein [Cyclobacteriaceae bacterium]
MRLSLAFIFCLGYLISSAQTITISGSVTDRSTGEPLPFASVGIKGKPINSITNLQGEFDFHLPAEYRNEILVISMLGYPNFEAPVWSLISDGVQSIQMEKVSTVLDEVIVADSLMGSDIFRIALSRIDGNYPVEPFMLDGFYRDIKKVGGTYISLLEAAVKIYDEDYKEPRNKFKLRERVKLIEVRQSLGYENRFTAYFDQDNLLEDLLLQNNVRYHYLETAPDITEKIIREKDSYYDGHRIYVLSYNHETTLKLFVDKDDYSIIHVEYETGPTDEVIETRKGLYSKFDGLKKTIDFKKYNNKMYLNFISSTSMINWYDVNTHKLSFETELHQQLLINKVRPNTAQKIGSTEKMKNYGLQYQDLPYNKKFWDNYNVIKDTPLDRQVLVDLEKVAPLDKQFEN